jgi:hypothetical protein
MVIYAFMNPNLMIVEGHELQARTATQLSQDSWKTCCLCVCVCARVRVRVSVCFFFFRVHPRQELEFIILFKVVVF